MHQVVDNTGGAALGGLGDAPSVAPSRTHLGGDVDIMQVQRRLRLNPEIAEVVSSDLVAWSICSLRGVQGEGRQLKDP